MALALSVAVAAGTAGVASAARPPTQAERRTMPTVIVALADSGINPYHQAFYRPQNTAHPCTWVRGFSNCSIPALHLTIGTKKSYAEAVAADRDVWAPSRSASGTGSRRRTSSARSAPRSRRTVPARRRSASSTATATARPPRPAC